MAEEREVNKNYIFGKAIGAAMSKMDQRLQYESAMMSMALIMIGMIVFTIYMDFFTGQTLFFKIMFTFNILCGLGLTSSFLVTQFQAYQNFISVMEEMTSFSKQLVPETPVEKEKPKRTRKRKKIIETTSQTT